MTNHESPKINVSIEHPTDRPNFTIVDAGPLTLWFSYKTVVAFRADGVGIVVRENDWGPTTGKHLNHIDGGNKAARLSSDVFVKALADTGYAS